MMLLFVFAPEKDPHPRQTTGFAPDQKYVDAWEKRRRTKNLWTRMGLAMICGGFIVQGAAVFLL